MGQEITEWRRQNPQVKSVTVGICDLNGAFRGKRVPVRQVEKVMAGGLRLPLSAATLDIWGRDIEDNALVFDQGDIDGICEVTDRGILPIDWTATPTAMLQVMLTQEDGSPFMCDPRRALEAVVARYRAAGLRPVVATELEFYLTDATTGIPRRPILPDGRDRLHSDDVLSIDELDALSGFMDDVTVACERQNIPVDTATSENGAGQFEFNLLHGDDPVRVADDAFLFKRVVRGVARQYGYTATFMAKPFGESAGNGFHVHYSLLDETGRNLFDNGGPEGTDTMQHAVGGILEAMYDATLIFAPHQNSFRRIRPGSHAPTAIGWGYENRTSAVRIPGGAPSARRIEHRVAGADANPYLVLAAILGSALMGMERKIIPPAPVSGNAYTAELKSLPFDWQTAISAFEQSPHMAGIFDPQLIALFARAKRQELDRFLQTVTSFEYQTYLETV